MEVSSQSTPRRRGWVPSDRDEETTSSVHAAPGYPARLEIEAHASSPEGAGRSRGEVEIYRGPRVEMFMAASVPARRQGAAILSLIRARVEAGIRHNPARRAIQVGYGLAQSALEGGSPRGLITTTALLLVEEQLWVAHIGDHRLYRLRGGQLERLTLEDTFAQHLVRVGQIESVAEVESFPGRPLALVAGMGASQGAFELKVFELEFEDGDLFLICSRDLHSRATKAQIREALTTHAGDLESAVEAVEVLTSVPVHVVLARVKPRVNAPPHASPSGHPGQP